MSIKFLILTASCCHKIQWNFSYHT